MRVTNYRRTTSLTACVSILALLVLGVAAPRLTTAQPSGSAAFGSYQFSLEDGYTKYIEFDARSQADGSTIGQMTFSDEAAIVNQDGDGVGDPDLKGSPTGVYIKADFDCLTINRNSAVMSGTVRDSSLRSYIGLRLLLVVEDNGDTNGDKLTLGFYKPRATGWTPTDAELKDDEGARLTWTATDAERKDDTGVPSNSNEVIGCQSFPLSSYSFIDMQRGSGNIQVQQ